MKVRAQDDMHFRKKSFTLHTEEWVSSFERLRIPLQETLQKWLFFHFDLHFIHSKQVLLRSNKHSSIFSLDTWSEGVSVKLVFILILKSIVGVFIFLIFLLYNSVARINLIQLWIILSFKNNFTSMLTFWTPKCNSSSFASSSHLLIIIYIMYLKQLTSVFNIERIQR